MIEFLFNLVSGSFGALCMVILGITAIILMHLVVPFKIASDSKRIMQKGYLNIALGIGAVFVPLLSIGYLFFNPKRIRLPLGFAFIALVASVGVFTLRAFVTTMYM